jgi:hypothetical protein
VDEIAPPVVIDEILQKRVIMKAAWIISESPCTDQLEHRTEAQPDPKKSTEVEYVNDELSGEEFSDVNDLTYEPGRANDDDDDKNNYVQIDDDHKEEFEQFLLWRQNVKPAVKTTSKSKTAKTKSKAEKAKKTSANTTSAKTTSKGGGKKGSKGGGKMERRFENALSDSDDNNRRTRL